MKELIINYVMTKVTTLIKQYKSKNQVDANKYFDK